MPTTFIVPSNPMGLHMLLASVLLYLSSNCGSTSIVTVSGLVISTILFLGSSSMELLISSTVSFLISATCKNPKPFGCFYYDSYFSSCVYLVQCNLSPFLFLRLHFSNLVLSLHFGQVYTV